MEEHASLTIYMAREVGQRLQDNITEGAKWPLIHPNRHMQRGTAGRAEGIGQGNDAGGGNARKRGSALDRVRGREVQQGVYTFHAWIRAISLPQAV